MTIQCDKCKIIPLNYITVEKKNLCLGCANKEYL